MLPAPARLPLAIIAGCAVATVVVLGLWFADQTTGTAFDVWLRGLLAEPTVFWHRVALVVDYTAEPVGGALLLAALVLFCLRLACLRTAVLAVAGTGGSIAVTTLLKPLVGREINGGFLSYPSGHTATATAVAVVAMLVVVRRRGRGMVLLAVVTVTAGGAMAWAQVLLNAHYPTDTLGGFATALVVVPVVAWSVDKLADRQANRRRVPDQA